MISALWYRNRVEMRVGFLLALAASFGVWIGFVVVALLQPAKFNEGWPEHAVACSGAVFYLWFLLSVFPILNSNAYTLTLPVSRFDLIWTRFACIGGAAFAVLFWMLALNSALLLVMGTPVRLAAMASSSLIAGLFTVVLAATLGLLAPLLHEKAITLLVPLGFIAAARWGFRSLVDFVASGELSWGLLGGALVMVGLALSTAGLVVRTKEF